MTRSFLAVIAEAAGVSENGTTPARAPLAITPAQPIASAQSVAKLSLPEQIVQAWISDPAIRAEFLTLGAYQGWRTHAEAKAAGVPVSQLTAQQPDVSGYLVQLEKKNGQVTGAEKSAIGGFAATWSASANIRAEFKTFECYAAYMRAKASGLIKRGGQGNGR